MDCVIYHHAGLFIRCQTNKIALVGVKFKWHPVDGNTFVKVIKKSLMSNTFSDVPPLDLIVMPTCIRHVEMELEPQKVLL
jgi:hypothetical protein